MDRFRDLMRRVWTWATIPRTRDPQREGEPILKAAVWLVAIPYFFGSAIYCGILMTKWAFGEPFRADVAFAVMCATMGVMLSIGFGLMFRRSRSLPQASA